MHLKFRNVNDAFYKLVRGIHTGEIPTTRASSRNGPVLQVQEPVLITYSNPKERVLFNNSRNANCFFSLYESLYMLSGGNLIAPLAYYAKNMENYSDDGITQNGAYGRRWLQSNVTTPPVTKDNEGEFYGDEVGITGPQYWVDQLKILINHLKNNPESRRAVLQMWNVEDDLLKVNISKDVCCLAGETKFRSPEGDSSIQRLAIKFQTTKGFKFPVYTIDTVTGDQRLSWMTGAWKTGVKPTIRLKLDDGSSIRLTRDHILFRKRKMFEGKRCIGISVSECQAGDIKVGDSLLAEMPEKAKSRKDGGGYISFKRNVFLNTGYNNMVKEHREYYEFVTGEKIGEFDIHHRDVDQLNNSFSNLEKLSDLEHQRRHKMGRDNPHFKMSEEDRSKRGKIHSAVMQSGGKQNTPEEIRKILNTRPPNRTNEQNEILWDWVCAISNHKVVEITEGGDAPVYDFIVPGRHNAVLSNGVLIHNCNLSVMFSIREKPFHMDKSGNTVFLLGAPTSIKFLDMTVTNRSNDMIWGTLGANVVHFSLLQEYVAAHLGVEVGVYNQFSNNVHVYESNWKPEEWLADHTFWSIPGAKEGEQQKYGITYFSWYGYGKQTFIPLVKNPKTFDEEMPKFVDQAWGGREISLHWDEPFLQDVALPMALAFFNHKKREYTKALEFTSSIKADDWKIATQEWIERRRISWEKKEKV